MNAPARDPASAASVPRTSIEAPVRAAYIRATARPLLDRAMPTDAAASDALGVVFPAGADGRRSSADTGRAIFADALRAADAAAADAAARERDWRHGYVAHVRRATELAATDARAAQGIAAAGLASLRRRLQFSRDGAAGPLEALPPARHALSTRTVRGSSRAGPVPLAVPWQGQVLGGDALRRQLDRWEADGLVEPSFAQALWRVQANTDWLDLSDQRIALLGAQAEMSPLPWLLRWRASVHAVDLPRAEIAQKMSRLAHAGNGTLHLPALHADASAPAGADLVRDTPEIAAWLAAVDGPLTVGAYAYLDGAQHVRVAAAMDAIQHALVAQRPDVTLAMLATPTDAYAVPADALRAAHARFDGRGAAVRIAQAGSAGRAFRRNGVPLDGVAADAPAGVVDAVVLQQGPNYVLAKRLQHWRALVARAQGRRVSIHVAPPALTGSVTKNRLLAAAYRAAHRFGAQAFDPATASALMAALLVHDLRHPQAAASPATALAHPLQLLTDAACHGGLWRMPYTARSALPMAALIGLLQR